MASQIDYATLPVPDDKPPEEYTYGERRSWLYDLIEEAGHPRNLERSQAELGRRCDVSQKTISNDIQAIREYEAETSGDDADANTEFVIRRSVRGLLDEGEFEAAGRMQLKYYDWLFDKGEREKAPDKQELMGEGGGPVAIEFNEEVIETPWSEENENE